MDVTEGSILIMCCQQKLMLGGEATCFSGVQTYNALQIIAI